MLAQLLPVQKPILWDMIDFPKAKKSQKTKRKSDTINSLDAPVMSLNCQFFQNCLYPFAAVVWSGECGLKWALRTSTQPENSIWCVCCRACLSPANLGPQPQASHLRQRVAFKEHNVTQNCVLTFAVWERRWKDFNVQSHIIYRDISSLLWNSFMEVVSLLTCYVNFGKSVNLSGILDKVQII